MEAVCEFVLPPDNAWDLATSGMIYAQLKDEFSIKEKHLVQPIEMAPVLLNTSPQPLNVSEKLFLYNTDRTMLVQIGQSRLAILGYGTQELPPDNPLMKREKLLPSLKTNLSVEENPLESIFKSDIYNLT
ncbi:MAG: hypothetical protein IT210_01765 [Armatimonadetes bacterium]|nr:hypothetical protein [Armatimonadota bacterium]